MARGHGVSRDRARVWGWRALASVGCVVLAAGCVGQIGASTSEQDGDPRGSRPPGSDALVVPELRRLTATQLRNTIDDLFGPGLDLPAVEKDTALGGFTSVGAGRVSTTNAGVSAYEELARAVAKQVFHDPERRSAVVPCQPTGTVDAACATQLVTRLGRAAFRRPLSDAEVQRYVGFAGDAAESMNDFWGGLEMTTTALLRSPNFLYRVELGEAVPGSPNQRRYTDWEMASRLSFLFWDTAPDEPLLEAASRGELSNRDTLVAQATRLLESARSRQGLRHYFSEMLQLSRLDNINFSSDDFPLMSPTLVDSMREEILAVAEHLILDEDGDYLSFFDTHQTFANAELATLCQLPALPDASFVSGSLPADGPRAGLLGRAAFLALTSNGLRTSPTSRGKYIREQLLCQPIVPPPPNVNTMFPELPEGEYMTARERLAAHAVQSSCSGCHSLMDPIGLALEHFDSIGGYREKDNGHDILTQGTLDGQPFNDARELGIALHNHPSAGPCLVRGIFRNASGHLETPEDVKTQAALAESFEASGHRVKQLLLDLVVSDGFRLLSAGSGPSKEE